MKVLVTGGAGFIGSHVAAALIKRGDEVVIVDDFNSYYSPALKEARVKKLLPPGGFHLERGNIADQTFLESIFAKHHFDQICHLAAQAGVRYSLSHPQAYEEANLKGFLSVLECARNYKVKSLIYASSSSVYGGNTKIPFSESDPVDRPLSLYAATKRANELMAYSYHRLFGLHTTGLRFFTVYGPWGRPDMALFLFTSAIQKGEPIKVFNQGIMKRDFTFIDDIVSGVLAALDKDCDYEIFNLGRGESQLLEDFIGAIEKGLGVPAKRELLPMQAGDVPATAADISKAGRVLGYNPVVSIAEGVQKFVEWYVSEADELDLDSIAKP